MNSSSHHLVNETDSIVASLKRLDSLREKILFVVDESNMLLGSVTDGDIRRGLIRGIAVDQSISNCMNTSCQYILEQELDKFTENNYNSEIIAMPIVDRSNTILDIWLPHSKATSISSPIVIMAGGKGKRLRPYTLDCPKPMLKVDGKPMLEKIIDQCISYGFQNYFISVNYLKSQIMDYFGDGSSKNISITYLEEDSPLGTAGSLTLLPTNLDVPFLIINGDVLSRVDYSRLINYHNEHRFLFTLCVKNEEYTIPFGVVKSDGSKVLSIEEKPTQNVLVNAGIYIMDPSLLRYMNRNEYLDMPTFISQLKSKNIDSSTCFIHEYWLDIGRKETLAQAQEFNN